MLNRGDGVYIPQPNMFTRLDCMISRALDRRRSVHQIRHRRCIDPIDAVRVKIGPNELLNFCSNDYLGLINRFRKTVPPQTTWGSGGSGLICGYTSEHARTEAELARWKGTESSIILPSGYQANLAAVQTLHAISEASGQTIRFIVDRLVHASLIDAIRQVEGWVGKPIMRVFPHNDVTKVQRLLEEAPSDETQVVVTESIFSMDGDAGELAKIAQLKSKYDFIFLVDEAHATGLYGPDGSGLVSQLQLHDDVDVVITTLSKALGLVGGAICGKQSLIESIINFGRAYIYSTSIPPLFASAVRDAIRICREEPHRRQRVLSLSQQVRHALRSGNISLFPGDSPIIPILFHDESRAIHAAQRLEDQGLLVLPIRPPTVPRGTSRLRITLSCEHSDSQVDQLIQAVLRIASGH